MAGKTHSCQNTADLIIIFLWAVSDYNQPTFLKIDYLAL